MFELVIFSFGFKYGLPDDATMVWDVRFLPNPYWVDEMRDLTGRSREVAEYVLKSEPGEKFMQHLLPMLDFLVEQNREAGKSFMRLAIGCTGGHHRSVAVVEELAKRLRDYEVSLSVHHRDMHRE